ncbi:Hypothetical predicted protein [Mytilus galloprovincialis]|uniref:C2H2-type domain-containing protein n=1 Tax=Mytilus galloprovincialis TaxID=29158 RepID=A0A8B6CA57_MYTGA|nr:Hypothetical predicted protein [Mytilus galloprovincialis]
MEAPSVESPSNLTEFVENLCVICGFLFIQKETKSDGIVITNKFLHRKLKLTSERFCEIEKVVGNLKRKKKDDNGVCRQCYRAVERVLRLEKEAKKTRARLLKSIETVEQSSKQSDTVCSPIPRDPSNRVEKNDTCNEAFSFNELTNLAKYVHIAAKPSSIHNCDQNVSKKADSTETVGRSLGLEQADNTVTETVGCSLGLEQADNTETCGRSLRLEQADHIDNVVCSLGLEKADNIDNNSCSLGLEQADNIQTVGHSLELDQQADNIDNVGRSLGLEQADNMYTETVSCSLTLGLEQADTCSSETVGCSLGPRSGTDDSNQTFISKSRKRKRKVDIRPNNTRTNRKKDKKVKSVLAKNLTNQDSNQDVTCSQVDDDDDDDEDDDDSNPTMYLVKTGLPKGADEIPKNNYQFVRSDFEHNYSKNAKVLPWVQGKQFVCPYCCTDKTGRSFDTEYELNMHKITHTGTMPQICQSCWKCFGTKEELFKHNFMVHNDLYRKQIEAQKNKYYRKIIPVEEGTSLQAIVSMDKFKESQTQNKLQVFSGDHETIEIHINEELGSSTFQPLNQDAVNLNDKSSTQPETVSPPFDNDQDASENYIKIEPESPTSYPLNQDAVHNNEGQQRPIEDFSCNYNAIESQVEETSGLPTMHPLNQDAVHNREGYEAYKLSYNHKLVDLPQSPTSLNLHENGKHNNDVLKKHLKMQKLSNPNSIEFCIKKKPESYKIYPIKLVAVHPSGNDKLQTELKTKKLSSRYNRIETQIEEAPEIHSVHPLKQDAVHNNEGQETRGETKKRSELNKVYPVELVAVHTNGGLPSVHPLNQDAVHMKEGFQTHLETQKVASDHDTIEVHIKEEPAWPEFHVIDQNAVHINHYEGLQKHQEIKNLSCVPNTKESVTLEETELPTMHSSKGDAMHNHDRIQKHLELHKLSLNHNQDNTIGFCIKEEPGLPTIHPLEQDAEAILEASQLQAQASATIFEQLQKEPLISHMDCLSQTEDSNHGNLHICSICNKEFKCLKGLQWHLCKKTYTCEICNAQFVADFLLQKHIEKHSNQKIFLCGICKAPFDAKIDRENHAKLVHGKRKKFHCKKCSIDFPNKYSRKKHNRLIHTGQIFFCNLCDKNLATKSSLERHNAETHSGLAKKNFACEICHKTFLRKSGLVRHMATHKKTKSFTCSTCSQTYDCKYDLWEHYKLCKKDVFQESS